MWTWLPVNEVDMTGYVQIHVQLSCFSLTCTEECVEKAENCLVSLLFSYVCLLDFMLLVCDDGFRERVVAPNSPVFILRRLQAFMFASKAFSSHFSCFVVDETRRLHADPHLIKTGKLDLGPLQKKAKQWWKWVKNWRLKPSLLTFWLHVLYFQWSTNRRCCHMVSPNITLKIDLYKRSQHRKLKGTLLFQWRCRALKRNQPELEVRHRN